MISYLKKSFILSFFLTFAFFGFSAQAIAQEDSQKAVQEVRPLFASVMASPMSYNFGTVHVNSYNMMTVYVTNTGDEVLRPGFGFASGSGFSGYHSCYGDLNPHQSCVITINYQPFFAGYSYGSYSMDFTTKTGFGSAHVNVSLWAQAIDYPR